ncbi:MAG TPA: SdrD B-like domain-containing protein, partial [Anaerolineales bacterium]
MIFDLRRVAAMLLLAMMLGGCSKTATQSPASGPTSSTATVTRSAASRTEPSAAPTTLPTLIAPALPPASMGPELKDFPSNYNPLTAQPVSDPASMKLPAMLVSISNFPATARPQAGLSFAPYVFEFSITEGATRFLTVFYGDPPRPEVPLTGSCAVRMEPFQQTSGNIAGNRIWLDENADGIQQFSEPGVGGVCVNLYDSGGTKIDQTTSDSNGYYGFN